MAHRRTGSTARGVAGRGDHRDAAERTDEFFDAERVIVAVAVAEGDTRAFALLYDEFAPRVLGLTTRVLRNTDLAEECTQDVFCELWRTAPQFDPTRGSVRGWVMTVAHHRAVDQVRRDQSARTRDDCYAQPTAGSDHSGVDDDVVQDISYNHERARLHRALTTLTPTQREAIELAYFSALTYQQVALRLNAPLGTVKSRIRDGLIRLQVALQDNRDPDPRTAATLVETWRQAGAARTAAEQATGRRAQQARPSSELVTPDDLQH